VALQAGSIFLLLIMVFLGMVNVRRLRTRALPQPSSPGSGGADRLSPQLQRSVALAEQALQQDRTDEAIEILRQEHAYRPSPASARLYAAVLARTRRLDELQALVAAAGEELDAPTLVAAASALVAGGRYDAGLRAAEAAWTADTDRSWAPAVVAAAARAGLRDVDGAIRWLYTAADRGWTDRRRLETDPLFAEVRADPRMGDLLARMGV
jgi:tetratricopeptide (TPR) repeat protein